MKIEIRYFGQIAELTDKSSEVIEIKASKIADIDNFLLGKYSKLGKLKYKYAQRNSLCSLNDDITDNYIALLPPFAGG